MREIIRKENILPLKSIMAFTLAEVLITLGIIGVVAAILIPNVMAKVQDWQFKQAAKEAFSKASQAVQQMKNDEGGSLDFYSSNDSSFKPVFIKYFKIIKDCDLSKCIAHGATSSVYKTLAGIAAEGYRIDEGQFITTDGMFWGIENEGSASVQPNLMITVDVNGYEKKPNVYGKDVFMFQLLNNNLVPMGAKGTYTGMTQCSRTSISTWGSFGCMFNVMQGKEY